MTKSTNTPILLNFNLCPLHWFTDLSQDFVSWLGPKPQVLYMLGCVVVLQKPSVFVVWLVLMEQIRTKWGLAVLFSPAVAILTLKDSYIGAGAAKIWFRHPSWAEYFQKGGPLLVEIMFSMWFWKAFFGVRVLLSCIKLECACHVYNTCYNQPSNTVNKCFILWIYFIYTGHSSSVIVY